MSNTDTQKTHDASSAADGRVGSSDSSASDEDAFDAWNRDITEYVPTLWDAYLFGLCRARGREVTDTARMEWLEEHATSIVSTAKNSDGLYAPLAFYTARAKEEAGLTVREAISTAMQWLSANTQFRDAATDADTQRGDGPRSL